MARTKRTAAKREAGPLRVPYEALKKRAKEDYGGEATGRLIMDLVRVALAYLKDEATPIELISRVPAKDYFSYALKTASEKPSSPINRDLFNPNFIDVETQWAAWEVGKPSMGLATLIDTMGTRTLCVKWAMW